MIREPAYFVWPVLLAFLMTGISAAPTCQPAPTIQLNLGNCTLLAADEKLSDINSFGLRMGVNGSSGSREICIAPSTVVNSPFITSDKICNDDQLVDSNNIKMTPAQCRSRRGGYIVPSEVQATDVGVLKQTKNDGWTAVGNTIESAVTASLQLGRQSISMVEGLIEKGQMSTQSHFGLAADSTALQTLYDAELIGAKSWGLNSGSQSVMFPRDGSLILGGYDDASLASQFFEFPVKEKLHDRFCPLQVTITGLVATIENANKSASSAIIGDSNPLDVCVEPYDNLFRMPEGYLTLFKSFFRDFTLHPDEPVGPEEYQNMLLNLEPGIVYPTSAGDFNATLRITINGTNGQLTVDVPPHEFQRPLRGLDKDGNVVLDTAYNELQMYGLPPSANGPVIGKALLSQLYLFVDYEKMKFYLARQNLHTTTPLPVSSVNCTSSDDNGGLTGSMKGLIAGVAVLGGLLLLLALLFFLFYKRKWIPFRREKHKPSSPASSTTGTNGPTTTAAAVPGGTGVVLGTRPNSGHGGPAGSGQAGDEAQPTPAVPHPPAGHQPGVPVPINPPPNAAATRNPGLITDDTGDLA